MAILYFTNAKTEEWSNRLIEIRILDDILYSCFYER